MLKLIWERFLRKQLIKWLEERALRLPAAQRHLLARKLMVSESAIEVIEATLREQVINAIESWTP